VDLTSGNGIECRSAYANNSYTMVFTFSNMIPNCGAANLGTLSTGPDTNQCSVHVAAPSGQHTTVQLTGVTDINGTIGNFSGTIGVLVGDTHSHTFVDSVVISHTNS